jgi:hypothetical protein
VQSTIFDLRELILSLKRLVNGCLSNLSEQCYYGWGVTTQSSGNARYLKGSAFCTLRQWEHWDFETPLLLWETYLRNLLLWETYLRNLLLWETWETPLLWGTNLRTWNLWDDLTFTLFERPKLLTLFSAYLISQFSHRVLPGVCGGYIFTRELHLSHLNCGAQNQMPLVIVAPSCSVGLAVGTHVGCTTTWGCL